MNDFFRQFAQKASNLFGSPQVFVAALALVVGWAASGPLFGFSDSWSLFINTVTTIITFLMVFIIQNTQNRDAKALHLKLDELIESLKEANNQMIDLEDLPDEELEKLSSRFKKMRESEEAKYKRR